MWVATVTLRRSAGVQLITRSTLGLPRCCWRPTSHWTDAGSRRRVQDEEVRFGLQRTRSTRVLGQDLQHVRWLSGSSRRDAEGGGPSSGFEHFTKKPETAETATGATPGEAASETSTAAGDAEAASETNSAGGDAAPEEQPTVHHGPRVLWTAPDLRKEFDTTEASLNAAGLITGAGLGLGLLGVAPFTPPTPFMVGLLLATVQVRLAHTWLTRQMRAQFRRNVTEVVCEVNEKGTLLTVKCDGGLVRSLRLTEDSETKPSMAEIISKGNTFIFLDTAKGKSEFPEELADVIESKRFVIGSEELNISPFPDESQDEADKVVQRLSDLTKDHLKAIGGKDGDASPSASLAQILRSSQIPAAVILTGGLIIGIGGRSAAGG